MDYSYSSLDKKTSLTLLVLSINKHYFVGGLEYMQFLNDHEKEKNFLFLSFFQWMWLFYCCNSMKYQDIDTKLGAKDAQQKNMKM